MKIPRNPGYYLEQDIANYLHNGKGSRYVIIAPGYFDNFLGQFIPCCGHICPDVLHFALHDKDLLLQNNGATLIHLFLSQLLSQLLQYAHFNPTLQIVFCEDVLGEHRYNDICCQYNLYRVTNKINTVEMIRTCFCTIK